MSDDAIRVWDADAAPEIEATELPSPRLDAFLRDAGFERLGGLVVGDEPPHPSAHPAWRRIRADVWRSADHRVLAAPARFHGRDRLALVSVHTDGSSVNTLWQDPKVPSWDGFGATLAIPPGTPIRRRPSARLGVTPRAALRWSEHHPASGVWAAHVGGPLETVLERHAERVLERTRTSAMVSVRLDLATAAALMARDRELSRRRLRVLPAHVAVAVAGPLGVALYGAIGWLVASAAIGLRTDSMPLPPETLVACSPWVLVAGLAGALAGVYWDRAWETRALLVGAACLSTALGVAVTGHASIVLSGCGVALVLGILWGFEGAAHVVGSQGLGPGMEVLNLHQLRLRYGLSDPPAES